MNYGETAKKLRRLAGKVKGDGRKWWRFKLGKHFFWISAKKAKSEEAALKLFKKAMADRGFGIRGTKGPEIDILEPAKESEVEVDEKKPWFVYMRSW